MRDHTHVPTPAGPRARSLAYALAVVALAVVALAVVALAPGTATAQSDQPTIVVNDTTMTANGTATVDVVLTEVPEGLSGYYMELTVEDGAAAQIESVTYSETFGMTSATQIGDGGRTVTLEAADVREAVEPGATDVRLATVTVSGVEPGQANLTVDPLQFDTDSGAGFQPSTRAGLVTVSGHGDTDTGVTAASDSPGDSPAGDVTATPADVTTDADVSDADAIASSTDGDPTTPVATGGEAAGASLLALAGGSLLVLAALTAVVLGRRRL